MTLAETTFALFALLLAPGPTNTLLALAGAERGLRGALPLAPLVGATYLAIVLPLAVFAEAIAGVPYLRAALGFGAGLWVARLALRIWHLPQGTATRTVGAVQLITTTALNPKALIIGLVLLPGDAALAPRATVTLAVALTASLLWIGLGSLTTSPARTTQSPRLRRVAAVWLGLLSAGLFAGTLTG